jgi:hypothetical protein
MGKLLIVEGDPVKGKDKHNVSGKTSTNPPVDSTWIGEYEYDGTMTDDLSDFVTIDGVPVATAGSKSSLDASQTAIPAGKHAGPSGSNFLPPAPAPLAISLSISDSVGTGVPNAGAGSAVLTINGVKALLDTDKIDSCSGLSLPAGSTVTAEGQDFVTAS